MRDVAEGNSITQVPKQVDFLVNLCPKKEVAVQAGGWQGTAPLLLSKHFSLVYTYEPEIRNYSILVDSIEDRNIIPMFGLLWNERGTGGLTLFSPNNSGDYRSQPDGNIPRHKIDDLQLPSCDLIWLDVQGDEHEALLGASDTINKYHPVIGFERHRKQPHSSDVGKFLMTLGYKYAGKKFQDRFYV